MLAIVAMLAALALPAFPTSTSRSRLEGFAEQTASILTTDRNAAIRGRTQVATALSAERREIRSGATGAVLKLPDDVGFDAIVAKQCAGRAAGSTIDFFPSGVSCGGAIALSRPGATFQVKVNWLTGGVEVVETASSEH